MPTRAVARAGAALPAGYASFLDGLKARIRAAQVKAALAVNAELVLLYWRVGRDILARQEQKGWGARVIDRLSTDLHAAFPEMKGFSPRNLKYMRAFAEAWPDEEIVQQAVARLPWGHNVRLLDRIESRDEQAMIRAACHRARMEPCGSRSTNRDRPAQARRQSANELPGHARATTFRPRPADPEGPLRLRLPRAGPRRAGAGLSSAGYSSTCATFSSSSASASRSWAARCTSKSGARISTSTCSSSTSGSAASSSSSSRPGSSSPSRPVR